MYEQERFNRKLQSSWSPEYGVSVLEKASAGSRLFLPPSLLKQMEQAAIFSLPTF